MTRAKVRICAKSIPWLLALHEDVIELDYRGTYEHWRDLAADRFDGWLLRSELKDLIRRRLLTVVEHGYDDSRGRDPLRMSDPELCGTWWSVNPTPRLLRALWPDRFVEAA